MAAYEVTGPCALLKIVDDRGVGSVVTYYEGAPVPSNVDPDSLQHNIDVGLVAAVDVADGGDPDDVDGDGPIPPKSADKATWVAFAVSQGADQATAESVTKDDLIAEYGKVS